MGRRIAGGAWAVPTAEATTSSSRSSALVFTPVLPVDNVADSGTASSARYQEDGQEYDSNLSSSVAALHCEKRVATFCVQDRRGTPC
jgi:hypothetical protein